MNQLQKHEIKTVELFPNIHNEKIRDFAASYGFNEVSKETILTCTRQAFIARKDDAVIELTNYYSNSLTKMHDQIFPNTYLSGKEMLNALNDETAAFGMVEGGDLLGYLYAEANPEFEEGSIEFIGVDPSARGKGVGSSLLSKGLKWIFSFPSIEEISLCVRSENSQAIHLYKKADFKTENELIFFEKDLE